MQKSINRCEPCCQQSGKSKCEGYILALNNFRIKVKLGAFAAERAKKQTIIINLKIFFATMPRACKTDVLQDTICYKTLCTQIKNFCAKQEFKLLEYLSFTLLQYLQKVLPPKTKFELQVSKNPKITGLESSSFTLRN